PGQGQLSGGRSGSRGAPSGNAGGIATHRGGVAAGEMRRRSAALQGCDGPRRAEKGGPSHMAKNPPEGSPNIFPALRYKNAPAALEWLGRAFGFEKQMVVPGPEGTIAHAQMKLGPGVIMLGSGKHGPGTDNPWNTVKQGVYVYVEDVDAHYARAKAAGAEIVMELEDTDYGS